MRVKRLEVQGFKSFKDKTVIHFDHGITGIVGPNGCGKSNIVDAFFWVMGEQSYKHMRGTSCDDLIFNGSSKYQPLGLAEATLVMETDVVDTENAAAGASVQDIPVHLRAKEVSVTRRLYRTGEGEYFINGVPARLKDIHELFMDTGVGAKGYSVIEQGQIGKIVNAKPEDRRLLIEEAAGIAKYKARKKESIRKMEATQGNLSRLSDVIQEIERNLASLERQAQKARQYKKHKEELLDKEMTWGRRKAQVIGQRLESLKKDKERFEQELLALKSELQLSENSIELDRVEQLTDTKLAEELRARIQAVSDELTQEKSALELSHRRQGDLQAQLRSLEDEKNGLNTSLCEENEKLAQRGLEIQEMDATFESARHRAQVMDEDVRRIRQEAENIRRDLDDARRQLMKGVQDSSALTSRGASLASRIETAGARAEKLALDLQSQNDRVVEIDLESTQAQRLFNEMKFKREALLQEKRDQSEQVQRLEQNLKQANRSVEDSVRALTQMNSKLQSLQELAQAYEGFGDGPKAALEFMNAQPGKGAVSALADAFEIDPNLEAALGGWLENRLENLITDEPTLALSALDQIRADRQGRAAIHLSSNGAAVGTYNSIRFDYITGLLQNEGFEVLGELAQLVKISQALPAHIQDIASSSVAHVAVVKSMTPLTNLISRGGLAKLGHWALVSLDGIALDQNGVLRGGSVESDGAASILRRKRVIAELLEQVSQAETAHSSVENSAEQAKEAVDLARARLQALTSDQQSLDIQLATLERDVQQNSRALQEAENQVRRVQQELDENTAEINAATEERSSIEGQLNEIAAAKISLETTISEGDAVLSARDAAVRAQEAELQELKVNEASLRERVQGLKREVESSKALIADRERRLSEINRILERATQEQSQFAGNESALQVRIEELTLRLANSKDEFSALKDRIERSSAKVNGVMEQIKGLRKAVEEKTGSSTQLVLDVERLSSDLTHLVQNLEEKYGPGCLEKPVTSPIQEEMSEPVVTLEMSAEEEAALGEEVERLRDKIRRLGEVNVMAIEEYDELKKRYDHLLTEKSDLELSIQHLQEAIEHINKTSEDRFKKAYDAINDRFQRLFPIIFGGGMAHLSLIFPEGSQDILEAGVDIMAMPPGKKVSNITLLSGGEKALTAVSLIFAIFMVKPSPFCVLDEVDAPLDDANIGKFNALLREMSAKSQFILITHNKKTMELNDTLYGVTMEEPGVSKMVSIEMR